jgi:cysteinyl-tRNA synthetase
MVEERTRLKKEKCFVEADKIRKDLEVKGIILEDRKDGKTIWRWKL